MMIVISLLLYIPHISGSAVFEINCLAKYSVNSKAKVMLCTNQSSPISSPCTSEERLGIQDFEIYLASNESVQCKALNETNYRSHYNATCLMENNKPLTKDMAKTLMTVFVDQTNYLYHIRTLKTLVKSTAWLAVIGECHKKQDFIDVCGNGSLSGVTRAHLKLKSREETRETKEMRDEMRENKDFQLTWCNCSVKTSSVVKVTAIHVQFNIPTYLDFVGRERSKSINVDELYWNKDGVLFETVQDFNIQFGLLWPLPKNVWLSLEGEELHIDCQSTHIVRNYSKYNLMVTLIFIVLVMLNVVPILICVFIKRYRVATRARDMVMRLSHIRKSVDISRKRPESEHSYVSPQSVHYDEMGSTIADENIYMSTLC
ncbi:hypothetical protein BgiMline_016252 [Biomphalaria glabrata]|nr:hypothetical protein BgiMline_009053 [Biomphalaria glabrata]